jgi:serine/threonine protein phosphatase 1
MIYVMADIHGSRRRFDSVMEQICLSREDTLYVLGDVIDRHVDGIRILRQLMEMPNARLTIGNHEYMMLQALTNYCDPPGGKSELDKAKHFRRWYRNGGTITHDYLKWIRREERERIFDFLRELPLRYDVEAGGVRYELVHAAPEDLYPAYGRDFSDSREFAVWKRWGKGEFPARDRVTVFGHTPTMYYQEADPLRIYRRDGVIDIDCGSGFPDGAGQRARPRGRLACLRLDDLAEFYSEEPEG